MTDTEINIAIAEACGWYLARKKFPNDKGSKSKYSNGYRYQHKDGRWASAGTSMHGWGWCSSPDAAAYKLPDYCHDLNAMQDAPHNLSLRQYADYGECLTRIVARNNSANSTGYGVFDATARQRAEAFLRCLGKWRDA